MSSTSGSTPARPPAGGGEEGGGAAGVAQLDELDVGQHPGAPPEAGEEKHRQHSAQEQRPPQPVAGDAELGGQSGHGERGVGGKSRRHHRRPRNPPGHAAAGDEKIGQALLGAPAQAPGDAEGESKIEGEDDPVGERERHGAGGLGGGASPRAATTASCTCGRSERIWLLLAVGWTRLVSKTTNSCLSGSIQMEVPVKPVWPKARAEK